MGLCFRSFPPRRFPVEQAPLPAPNVELTEQSAAIHRSRWARNGLLILICLAGLWAWVLFIRPLGISEASHEVESTATTPLAIPSPVSKAEPELTPEQRQKKMVQGTWEDLYEGHRLLTIRDDGTASMSIELDGLAATLFAQRLEFDIRWTLEKGRVVMQTTGGRPEKKADLILKVYGNRAEYHVDGVEENRLLLRDVENNTKFEWKRPGSTAAKTASAK